MQQSQSELQMVNFWKCLDVEIFEGKVSKHQYPWHFHDSFTIIIVESGEISYEFTDSSILLGEAEVLILEPNRVHRNIIAKPTVYKALIVPVEYLESPGQTKIVTQKIVHPVVVEMMAGIADKIKQSNSKIELKSIFNELCECTDIQKVWPKLDASFINNPMASKINLDLPIKKLAEEAHLSKFHYQRKFKQTSGLTVGQLKQQEKTVKAKLLLEKGKPPTDVAYELGYFDQSHFIKYFRKMWIVTPKYFKK